jgi:hypothetical protein
MFDTDPNLEVHVGTRRKAARLYVGTVVKTDPTFQREVGTPEITALLPLYYGTMFDTDPTLDREVGTRRLTPLDFLTFGTMFLTNTAFKELLVHVGSLHFFTMAPCVPALDRLVGTRRIAALLYWRTMFDTDIILSSS